MGVCAHSHIPLALSPHIRKRNFSLSCILPKCMGYAFTGICYSYFKDKSVTILNVPSTFLDRRGKLLLQRVDTEMSGWRHGHAVKTVLGQILRVCMFVYVEKSLITNTLDRRQDLSSMQSQDVVWKQTNSLDNVQSTCHQMAFVR